MQIEKESSNRIKVTLKPTDFQKMNVSLDTLKPNSPQLHTFLYEIMERVREQTGFNPYMGQVMVEALPMGECMELTVTRISALEKSTMPANKKLKNARAVIKKIPSKQAAFYFDNFDDFCKALILLDHNFLKNCIYYKLNDMHILFAQDICDLQLCLLKEYCTFIKKSSVIDVYMEEHAKYVTDGDGLVNMSNILSSL